MTLPKAREQQKSCNDKIEYDECGGVYYCQFPLGHEKLDDKRMKNHRAACRKHHGVIMWEPKP